MILSHQNSNQSTPFQLQEIKKYIYLAQSEFEVLPP